MKYLYLIITLCILNTKNIKAQTADYFLTINTTTATNLTIDTGIEFNGYRYFSATKNFTESTIWKTNGTEIGTSDFINSDDITSASPIFVFNNELYYNAFELGETVVYKTNGAAKTPFLQENTESPVVGFDNRSVAILDTNFVFRHGTITTGYELYISDGTPNNPVLLKDIRPGASSSQPNYFTKVGEDKVVFIANDGTNGIELWVTDGTNAGTLLVKDINTSGNSFINGLTSFNGKAYFSLGNDIWETDGTEAGTVIFLNLRMDSNSEYPFYEYNNELYFTAYDTSFNFVDLWKTDGTVAGSTILTSGLNYADVFQRTNNYLFFAANTDANGYELWRTNGTPGGTLLTRDINPGPEDSLVGEPSLGNGGNLLFFEATFYDDDPNVEAALSGELWSSNGTETGTLLNTTINPSSGRGQPDKFFNTNGKLIFQANGDGSGASNSNQGIDLWITNANLLSIEENKSSLTNFLLYPNPSSDTIAIKDVNNTINEIAIFSLEGRKVKTITSNFQAISVKDLYAGTYLVSIQLNDGKHSTLKFLKQ